MTTVLDADDDEADNSEDGPFIEGDDDEPEREEDGDDQGEDE